MNTSIKKRIAYIDLIECIAMVAVLIYHSSLIIGYNTSFNIVGSASFASTIYYWFRGLLSCGAPLFFMANGYLLFNSDFDLKKHGLKTLKFAIITVIWTLITVVILQTVRGESHSVREIIDVVLHLNLQNYTNHLWFMGALVSLYIIFPILKAAFDNSKKSFLFFLILCFALVFGNTAINRIDTIAHAIAGSYAIADEQWLDVFNPFQWKYAYVIVYFCLGGLMPCVLGRVKKINHHGLIAGLIFLCSSIAVAAWSIVASNLGGENYDIVWNNYGSVFVLINTVCVFILCAKYEGNKKPINSIITTVSKNTIGIYFIHLLFIYPAYELLGEIHIGGLFVDGLIVALVSLTVSTIVSVLIRKIPVVKNLL